MDAFIRRTCIRRGFSLVEILVTVAVISLLIALFIPAINKVGEVAARVRQKAQFANIEIGLEAYSSDYGDYPISFNSGPSPTPWVYTGAQILGEAIVGMDGLGFHPDSILRRDGLDTGGNPLYYRVTGGIGSLPQPEQDANVQSRTGPYLENDAANAVRAGDIYEVPIISAAGAETMVLADMFTKKMNTGKKTGMPILYYKANSLKTGHATATMGSNVYEYTDNFPMLALGVPWGSGSHSLMPVFYRNTQDPRFTAKDQPYRSKSFILLSAGKDGLYGTADDIYNFDCVEQ